APAGMVRPDTYVDKPPGVVLPVGAAGVRLPPSRATATATSSSHHCERRPVPRRASPFRRLVSHEHAASPRFIVRRNRPERLADPDTLRHSHLGPEWLSNRVGG